MLVLCWLRGPNGQRHKEKLLDSNMQADLLHGVLGYRPRCTICPQDLSALRRSEQLSWVRVQEAALRGHNYQWVIVLDSMHGP